MDKELHEKALNQAIDTLFETQAKDDGGRWKMQSAIAAYLKTAGLTVVPVETNEAMIEAVRQKVAVSYSHAATIIKEAILAFPSPFDEVK